MAVRICSLTYFCRCHRVRPGPSPASNLSRLFCQPGAGFWPGRVPGVLLRATLLRSVRAWAGPDREYWCCGWRRRWNCCCGGRCRCGWLRRGCLGGSWGRRRGLGGAGLALAMPIWSLVPDAAARFGSGAKRRRGLDLVGDHHQAIGHLDVGTLLDQQLFDIGKLFVETGQSSCCAVGSYHTLERHCVVAITGGQGCFEQRGPERLTHSDLAACSLAKNSR